MKSTSFNWIKTVRRPYPPFYSVLIINGYSDPLIWKKTIGYKYSVPDMIGLDGIWYYPSYHLRDFAEKFAKKLFTSPSFFTSVKKQTIALERNLLTARNKDIKSFITAYQAYMPALALYLICDDLIENKVTELLTKHNRAEKVKNLINIITIPKQDNFYRKACYMLATSKNVKHFIAKFGWLNARYGSLNGYKEATVKKLLRDLEKNDFLKKYTTEQKSITQAVIKSKQALGSKSKHIIDMMQFFIYYRTQRSDIINLVAYDYAKKLAKLGKVKGLSYDQTLFCTPDELLNTPPTKEEIRQRQKGFGIIGLNGKYSIIHGKALAEWSSKLEQVNTGTSVITGRCAYPGKVKGIVKIIKNSKDLLKLKKDEILVTSMTTPEMIFTMNKAKAIITDEGGITCHAAIIAREMNKPCIIGTKIATTVLKDGDIIELDAENGLVRLIDKTPKIQ